MREGRAQWPEQKALDRSAGGAALFPPKFLNGGRGDRLAVGRPGENGGPRRIGRRGRRDQELEGFVVGAALIDDVRELGGSLLFLVARGCEEQNAAYKNGPVHTLGMTVALVRPADEAPGITG